MKVEVIDLSATQAQDPLDEEEPKEQEVFETSDNEGLVDEETDEARQDQEVVSDPVASQDEARTVFESTVVVSTGDFSGRIDRCADLCRTGRADESVDQRLARIGRELQEIELERGAEEYADEAQGLQEMYRALERERARELGRMQARLQLAPSEEGAVRLPRVTLDAGDCERIVELERKIASLEASVGQTSSTKSVVTCVNELFHKVSLLENNEPLLEKFETSMKRISKEYEESIIGRRATKDPALQKHITEDLKTTDTKVAEIYNSYNLLKKYAGVLPDLINRVQSLNTLHREVRDAATTVQDFDQNVAQLSAQADRWDTMLTEMEEKLDQHEASFEKNKETIFHWVSALEAKLDGQKGSSL
ncbi:ABR141Wp [Eremothecium gossypii ATCC 10895]|uniref:ABR141Wp n=1 Tax=Eremothecium gossypii (strain ATCC 10895 / CBS 109.51 / FGSC 9923 / NRRL Y-1056) TaxID=284811 RepID=Q75D83_EREGS|nr:ABR141Wp [Eremothecium gossypii ATCC 10895]AAS50912.2 ABR141Wp [Eremothecium gossypii ATCC 10895]AEY95201.1 FABR141Wp [Eremothecium gossypii FDAG1]